MEKESFNQQVQGSYSKLKSYALKLTQNMEDAEDLTQDTMLKAIANQDKFQDGTNLKGWMYTIMKNVFINNYRRNKKSNITHDDTDNQYYINNTSFTTGNEATSKLALKDINNAIGLLADNLKIPFLMSFTGYKYDEISNYLSLPLGTVKIRIHCARKKLKASLRTYGKEYGFSVDE
ncbi:MAG: RNA polymerase sigma factor [Bacteroidetes bacterium]|nr:RNA polymerase sigma factor [Bacteroidota bacterium]